MVEKATTDAEAAPAEEAEVEAAPMHATVEDDKAGENENTGAADAQRAHKSPSTAQKSKPKRMDVEPDKIVSGSRHRKSVAFYQPEKIHVTEKLTVEPGKGEKLSAIPNVAFKLGKLKARDKLTEMIHTLLFKRKGEVMKRKRDIGEFSGWVFSDDEREREEERASEYLSRFTNDALHEFLDILDLPRGGDKKEAKVKRITEFLEEPKVMSEKDLAAKDAKKKAAVKRKRESKPAKAAKAEHVAAEEDEDVDEEEAEDDDDEQEEVEEQPKRRRSKSNGKAATPKSKAAPTKTSKGRGKAVAAEANEDDEDDDMPLAAAAATKKMPSDKQLVTSVEEILAGEDVQSFALSALMKRLCEKHGLDVSKKKPIIKATAIRYCQEHAAAVAAAEEDVADGDEEAKQGAAEDADGKAEEEHEAAEADEQRAEDINTDKNPAEEHTAEDGAHGELAATEAEQDEAAQKAALAAGNGEEPEL